MNWTKNIIAFLGYIFIIASPTLSLNTKSSNSLQSCDCGISEYGLASCGGEQGRIVGGRETMEKEIPWQVRLTICHESKCKLCGGSIIGKRYILTAAHCIEANDITVTVGAVNIEGNSPYQNDYFVTLIKVHEKWNWNTFMNDIALLRVERDIEFNPAVKPICLPSNTNNSYAKSSGVVSGWGSESENEYSQSLIMKRTVLKITGNDDVECRNNDDDRKPLFKGLLCAYGINTDSCYGDSGGPLTVVENDKCSLAGLVSYGYGCARPGYAGVYTRISEYLDWINENTMDDTCLNRT